MLRSTPGSALLLLLNTPAKWLCRTSAYTATVTANDYSEFNANLDPHPNPNEEHYDNMIYVGRMMHNKEKDARIGFDVDNSIKYIFGTGFDESHEGSEEQDLHHEHYGSDAHNDLPQHKSEKTRENVLQEKRHGERNVDSGPKPFGYTQEHPLDGGAVPPKEVCVEPFFLDETPVTNKEFGKFVRSTYYETEAEHFGWSFVLSSFLPKADMLEQVDTDPGAEHWVTVEGAYWRRPEGPLSTYKKRESHPVVHISHRDAAEYCKWVGKRLPGEREYEAAARAGNWGPNNRTLYSWGGDSNNRNHTTEVKQLDAAIKHANLWGGGKFPWVNNAEDGWRGTSPVKHYLPNLFGFYDTTGNVWEWMRGGKHKARIVRGASFVDSIDGSFNHAATLGARSTIHGTTTTGNVGFRCARSPKRRTKYQWVNHDEELHGQLVVEDEFGERDMIPQQRWEDKFDNNDGANYFNDGIEGGKSDGDVGKPIKKKVVQKRTRVSTEL